MMRRLLWKEWRENQWKLGFCVGVSLAFTTLLFRRRIFPDLQNAFFISLVQTIVVPVVFALDLFSGEMSNRTIHLLFKIPVPRWKIFFAKYLVVTVGIALSFLVTATAMEAMVWGRYIFNRRFAHSASPIRDEVFTIPLLPGDSVDIRERVKLSVDLAAGKYGGNLHQETLVSDSNNKMRFASVIENGMARYDVVGWDREEIQCRFRDARRYLFGGDSWRYDAFVHAGRYYVHNWNTLMVFDLREDRGIRKIGHFQRFSTRFSIREVGVDENGNIVVLSRPHIQIDDRGGDPVASATVYLLRAP